MTSGGWWGWLVTLIVKGETAENQCWPCPLLSHPSRDSGLSSRLLLWSTLLSLVVISQTLCEVAFLSIQTRVRQSWRMVMIWTPAYICWITNNALDIFSSFIMQSWSQTDQRAIYYIDISHVLLVLMDIVDLLEPACVLIDFLPQSPMPSLLPYHVHSCSFKKSKRCSI